MERWSKYTLNLFRIGLILLATVPASFVNSQSWVNESSGFGLHLVQAILVDKQDMPLVVQSAEWLRQDLVAVFGTRPEIMNTVEEVVLSRFNRIIIIGSLKHSNLIKSLVAQNQIDPVAVINQWEGYQVQVVEGLLSKHSKCLIISGSDRRGTAYGVLELSRQMGVSPWYWWADVPIAKKNQLFIKNKFYALDAPRVKYRGIFINDEAPALSGWTKEKFGGFNHLFYEKVFELILRLKGNYLWPAMWGNAFYDDDPKNGSLADKYGIVIGTSHHEPLMRAHDEWRRYGKKQKWNYDSTEAGLKEFWKAGMKRASNEKIVSVGMRGDGDEPMSRETATALLERIVNDQRVIIGETTGKPVEETPQLWALYKEVQDYYDQGMRVPDDVTLLLCDDNWGNIRKLPNPDEPFRKGGYGIYYHFDYVGGPRNYKWLNTNPLPRIWEQMHLAWEHNVKQIWIVNVGDIKPMELPISFFLDYAWNPVSIGPDDIQAYTIEWNARQFGPAFAREIAAITASYLKINGRRKPELLDARTHSLENYNEAQRVTNEYQELLKRAEKINGALPENYKAAYYQLVLHPVQACANLYQLYLAVAKNHWYAKQKSPLANTWADKAREYFQKDSMITVYFNQQLCGGKWNHMMDQTHIGYTYWQQPPYNRMPQLYSVNIDSAALTPAVEPWSDTNLETPATYKKGKYTEAKDGVISLAAARYTRAINSSEVKWVILPDHGRTSDALTTFPVNSPDIPLTNTSPRTEYQIKISDTGTYTLQLLFSPTLNFHHDGGLLCAVSIDGDSPQVINLNENDQSLRTWESWVANNIIIKTSQHRILKKGKHTIKYWMIHPGVVLQKIVLDVGGLKPSYLGPPEMN